MSFDGRTIAVTGGGAGIGAGICRALASAGANVVVLDRDIAKAQSIASEIGGTAFEVDVTDETQVGSAYNAIDNLTGSVNCAGFNFVGPIVSTSLQDWRRMIGVHLDGAFLNLRSAARAMLRNSVGGSIVNIASINGFYVHRGMAGYAAAKAGVTMMTRTAALELATSGIRVNAVAPGIVETEMTRPVTADPNVAEQWVAGIPLGRLGQPGDIADVVAFLLRDDSRWITGQTIMADGGASLRVEPVVTDDSMWTNSAMKDAARQ
jgi:NAD(P)-dependent dehydrogenase (short-subunit alcohol dehydrogenase family)